MPHYSFVLLIYHHCPLLSLRTSWWCTHPFVVCHTPNKTIKKRKQLQPQPEGSRCVCSRGRSGSKWLPRQAGGLEERCKKMGNLLLSTRYNKIKHCCDVACVCVPCSALCMRIKIRCADDALHPHCECPFQMMKSPDSSDRFGSVDARCSVMTFLQSIFIYLGA